MKEAARSMNKLSEIDAPNEAGAVDGGIPLLLYIARAMPATTDPHCSSGARCCDPEFYFSLKNPDSGPIMRPTPVGPQLNGVGADGPAGVGILGDYTCCSGWVFESHKFR